MSNKKSNAINTYDQKPDLIPQGMLSAAHIRYCVKKFKIFTDYKESCLSSATYHMRLGGQALTWDNGKKRI